MMGFDDISADGAARQRVRTAKDVAAIFDRLGSEIPDHLGDENEEYTESLREAVAAVFNYCLATINRSVDATGAFRRCKEAERLFRKILAAEMTEHPADMHAGVLRAPESAVRRPTASIEAEREPEISPADGTTRHRREQIVRRLLVTQNIDDHSLAVLQYSIHSRSHIGIVATGADAEAALGRLTARYGHNSLVTAAGNGEISAWIADQGTDAAADLERLLSQANHPAISAGVAGPHSGLDGFRRAHEEAREALVLAHRGSNAVAHYNDNPLLAAILHNEPLRRWLKDLIAPLEAAHRQDLRAYIDARCNASSAASAMRIHRHTVKRHVDDAEERLKRRLEICLAEIHVALRLAEFEEAAVVSL